MTEPGAGDRTSPAVAGTGMPGRTHPEDALLIGASRLRAGARVDGLTFELDTPAAAALFSAPETLNLGKRMQALPRLMTCFVTAALAAGFAHRLEVPASAAPDYPEPRFPKYLRTVTTVEPLMPSARLAVRQIAGRTPLGLVRAGEHLLIVVPDEQDALVLKAIRAALEERRVKVTTFKSHEMKGLTAEQERANRAAFKPYLTSGAEGWKELSAGRLSRFLPEQVLKELSPPPPPHAPKTTDLQGTVTYVAAHPDIDRVIFGGGGRARQQRAFGSNAAKFLGNWTYVKQTDLLSKIPEFPGDVWKMAEEKVLDALPFIESVRMTDPEGTDVSWSVTEEEAEKHAKAALLQGHLFMYPLQGSRGILEAAFDSQVFPDSQGVLAGCSNHTAYFPCVKTYIEHGQISRIEGGGKMGDLARLLLNNPELKTAKFPDAPRPGYWYWFEAALGTNPKYFRPINALMEGGQGGINTFERNRSGIFHFGMGFESLDKQARAYCDARNLPCDHAWHIHNYFITYAAKLRDEKQTVNIVDRGRLTTLDNAEVRALASRYGDPDLILREEWVPGMPGINEPGNYERDYAPDPWKWIKKSGEEIQKGTYKYLLEGYPTPGEMMRTSK